MPHAVSAYDEGYTGLSGTWWNNPDLSGAAETYSTAAANANWGVNPPADGLDPEEFSGRLAGRVQVDQGGEYLFGTAERDVTDGLRVYVDDNLVANRTYAPNVYALQPVGYWRLGDSDTVLRDMSGNGHRGAYTGEVTRGVRGAMPDDNDTAADFTGGKAEIPDADALDVTGPLTIELWVKPDHNADGGGWQDLVSKYGGTDGAAMPFELSLKADLTMQLRQSGSGDSWQAVNSDEGVVANQWNHVAVTRDADNNVTFYLNGEKAGSGSFTEPGAANAQPLVIGRRATGGNALTEIDEVSIFDKALVEEEIAGHVAGAGTVNDGRKRIQLDAGSHRLRVEYQRHPLRGNLSRTDTVNFTWYRIGGTGWTVVPTEKLSPDYGLVTSTTEFDSQGVPNKRKVTSYGENLDPAFGVTERAVANPDGLAMSGTATYETPGQGFLRRTAKTMPTGAQTSYTYYGTTEQRDNPCTPESDPAIQSGLLKLATAPSAADGTTRVDERVYDKRGRIVAEKVASGGWICTTYDARGRVASYTYPPTSTASERVVTYTYAVDGDPLVTSVADHTGTVTTENNLLAQVVAYTDAHGVRTLKSYDARGRVAQERVLLPREGDGVQVTTYEYDDAGRLLTTALDDVTLATAVYDQAGELASVDYGNGTRLAHTGADAAGRRTELAWELSDGTRVASSVARSRSGTIVDESLAGVDARPDGPNYVYDTVGRLAEAYVPGHHYSYDFTSDAAAVCPEGTQSDAGRNTNRVRLTDETTTGTAVTGYCYDAADRLLATHGALGTSYEYDAAGNTTSITEGEHTTHLGWDSAGRNVSVQTTGPEPATVSYQRDALDRIVQRGVSGNSTGGQVLYGYTGEGDNAALTLTADQGFWSRTISLPGGVLYTLKAGQDGSVRKWDHPSIRGDLVLTIDVNGAQEGPLRWFGPYGQPLTSDGAVDADGVPDNQPGEMDYGWLGQFQRPYEHAGSLALVQMGARPYSPALGRFLSVDPQPGGSANDYDYVGANPINTTDLDGNCFLICDIVDGVKNVAKGIKKGVEKAASWVADNSQLLTGALAVGCIVVSAGVCAVAGAGLALGTYAAQGLSPNHEADWQQALVNLAAVGAGAAAARWVGGPGALRIRGAPKTIVRRKEAQTRYTKQTYTTFDWATMGALWQVNQFFTGILGFFSGAMTCAIKLKWKDC